MVFIFGVLLMGVLVVRKVRGGLLIGIVVTTILAAIIEAVADVGPRSEPTPKAGTSASPPRSRRCSVVCLI